VCNPVLVMRPGRPAAMSRMICDSTPLRQRVRLDLVLGREP
jgi:hypothetical protein